MRSLLLIFSALFTGCAAAPVGGQFFEPYVLPHKDGGNVMIFHEGNTTNDIEVLCPWMDGYTTFGCARLQLFSVEIPSNTRNYSCWIVAEYPNSGFTQSVWDHEEAHCMGWLHKEGFNDPIYELAHKVGK